MHTVLVVNPPDALMIQLRSAEEAARSPLFTGASDTNSDGSVSSSAGSSGSVSARYSALESRLVLVGVCGLRDPARPEVRSWCLP